MAAQFVTLGEIIASIRYRANLGGHEDRHSNDRLKALFNESNQALREKISKHTGHPWFKRTPPAALPTTAAVTGDVYAQIEWPVDALSIHSVRVLRDSRWYPLVEIEQDALHDYQDNDRGFGGLDRVHAYSLGKVPYGSGTNEVPGDIQLVPIPTGGQYSLWYVESWTPITDDDAVVNSFAAFLEWAIWDVVVKTTAKSGKGGHTYNTAVKERMANAARIESRATRLSQKAAVTARDSRGDGYSFDWLSDY